MLGMLFIAMSIPIHTLLYLAFLFSIFSCLLYSLLIFNEHIMYHSLEIYIYIYLANYGPAFVNTVLEHSHPCSFANLLSVVIFVLRTTELRSCDRDYGL